MIVGVIVKRVRALLRRAQHACVVEIEVKELVPHIVFQVPVGPDFALDERQVHRFFGTAEIDEHVRAGPFSRLRAIELQRLQHLPDVDDFAFRVDIRGDGGFAHRLRRPHQTLAAIRKVIGFFRLA